MEAYAWFAIFAGCNGLIILALACLVSYRRISLNVPHGDGGHVLIKQAIRSHGNAVEHVPIMGLIVLALCLLGAFPGLTAGLVVAFTFSRLLHPVGMLTKFFNARRLGALMTYSAEGLGAAAVLLAVWR